MTKKLLIRLHLDRIRANLAKEDGREWSDDDVRRWLVEAGFTPSDGGWLVDEPNLGQLDPSEVAAVEDAP